MKQFILFLSLLLSFLTKGQDNLSSDRPGQANSPLTVDRKQIQFQFGTGIYNENSSLTNSVNKNFISTGTLRLGLGLGLEGRMNCNYNWNQFSDSTGSTFNQGPNDWFMSFRKEIINGGDSSYSLGTQVDFYIPFKNELYIRKSVKPRITFMFNAPLFSAIGINANLGYQFAELPTEPSSWFYVLNLSYAINEKLGGFIEIYGNWTNKLLISQPDAGFYYYINANLQLDLYAGFSNHQNNKSTFVNVGFSWRSRKKKNQVFSIPGTPSF